MYVSPSTQCLPNFTDSGSGYVISLHEPDGQLNISPLTESLFEAFYTEQICIEATLPLTTEFGGVMTVCNNIYFYERRPQNERPDYASAIAKTLERI